MPNRKAKRRKQERRERHEAIKVMKREQRRERKSFITCPVCREPFKAKDTEEYCSYSCATGG